MATSSNPERSFFPDVKPNELMRKEQGVETSRVIPPKAEPWLQLLLRKCLKQPLNTAVASLSDEDAQYMKTFIESMDAPLGLLLETWGLPQPKDAGFWKGEVLPLLNRKVNSPPLSSRPLYPTDSFKAVKAQVDIVEIAGRYTELMPSGNNFKAACPLHSERTPSFYIYPDRQAWHCYGACGRGGDVIELVRLLIEVDIWQAH